MNPLVSTLADGTVHVWEAAVVAAAMAFRGITHQATNTRQATYHAATLKDIGVEPGAITWMR